MIKPLLLVLGSTMVVASVVGCGPQPSGLIMSTRYQPPGVEDERYCSSYLKARCVTYETRRAVVPAISDLMLRQDNGEIATVRVEGADIQRCRVGARYPECTQE